MPAGEPTWARVEVLNTGRDDLIWFHDGCAIAVGLRGEMTEARWRPGVPQSVPAAAFKTAALEDQNLQDGTVHINFVPERFIRIGHYACADVGLSDRIAPGRAIRQRARWDGYAGLHLGPPPSGRVQLIGWAGYYWRARAGQPANIGRAVVKFEHEAWIVDGKDPLPLDPAEVVDAAVRDSRLLAELSARDIRDGHAPILWFDPKAGMWQVGILSYGRERLYLALVDPATGDVSDFVQRRWDPERDGYP